MENNPLVSVVTVVYNAAEELEKTIQTVVNQTYKNIEYIIIDGGSTDGTIEVIKKYQDKIAYWISESDKGVYDAMNKGISTARGEWINFMNAGDYFYAADVLEKVFVGKDDRYKGFDVVYGDAEFRLKEFSYIVKAIESTPSRFMPFSHQAAFVRTGIAKKYPFDRAYKIAADTEFFLKLTRQGKVFKHIPVIVSSYDTSEGLSATNEGKRAKEIVEMQIRYGAKMTMYYRKFILDAYMKQFMRYVIPENIWVEFRKKKIKNKLNKKENR